jgi:hypothetical protein
VARRTPRVAPVLDDAPTNSSVEPPKQRRLESGRGHHMSTGVLGALVVIGAFLILMLMKSKTKRG